MTGSAAERRKFHRVKKEFITYFEIVESDLDVNLAGKMKSQDISTGGMLFEGSTMLSMGSVLKLDLQVPENKKPLRVFARVVRLEEITEDIKYEIGVVFVNLTDDQKRIVQQILGQQTDTSARSTPLQTS